MREKVSKYEAIDISDKPKNKDGDYILNTFIEDKDYCDIKEEFWIWSIGEHIITGEILASTSNKFYQNPDYNCLFLR